MIKVYREAGWSGVELGGKSNLHLWLKDAEPWKIWASYRSEGGKRVKVRIDHITIAEFAVWCRKKGIL